MLQKKDLRFIVKLYETFADEYHVCFVMEFLEGQDLY